MNTQIFSIILMIVIVLLGFLLYYFVQSRKNPSARQNQAREYAGQKAASVLRRFSKSNGYRFLSNLSLENGTTLNGLCVGEFGLLGIKTYGYNGNIYGNVNDKKWLRVGHSNSREYFPNPLLEANQDIQALRKRLQNTKARNTPIEIVVVFTNPKVELATEKNSNVLQMKGLSRLLSQDKYQKQNGVQQDLVADTLQGN